MGKKLDKRTEKKSERFEIRLPHTKKQAFIKACDEQGDTPSFALRRFINSYIKRANIDNFKFSARVPRVFLRRYGVSISAFLVICFGGGAFYNYVVKSPYEGLHPSNVKHIEKVVAAVSKAKDEGKSVRIIVGSKPLHSLNGNLPTGNSEWAKLSPERLGKRLAKIYSKKGKGRGPRIVLIELEDSRFRIGSHVPQSGYTQFSICIEGVERLTPDRLLKRGMPQDEIENYITRYKERGAIFKEYTHPLGLQTEDGQPLDETDPEAVCHAIVYTKSIDYSPEQVREIRERKSDLVMQYVLTYPVWTMSVEQEEQLAKVFETGDEKGPWNLAEFFPPAQHMIRTRVINSSKPIRLSKKMKETYQKLQNHEAFELEDGKILDFYDRRPYQQYATPLAEIETPAAIHVRMIDVEKTEMGNANMVDGWAYRKMPMVKTAALRKALGIVGEPGGYMSVMRVFSDHPNFNTLELTEDTFLNRERRLHFRSFNANEINTYIGPYGAIIRSARSPNGDTETNLSWFNADRKRYQMRIEEIDDVSRQRLLEIARSLPL